ncbi:hydroxyproline dehydrogenase-like [Gigantopelta aegis]|uniref:hydroxyproline dehydrogenase-like n=1 Tax=Gigantopelta aegis TaxID=1735272 RepID=UPI001B889D65|nr:hydroxyproline dehydrogenase-like [Gigantopelta aegis]XP_041347933.1 hydroxyproline dehydrogenase-like [Gigantopelta aegis]
MVDAEYTYINPALNLLTMSMMLAYNTERTVVLYTYQNYLKHTDMTLRRDNDYISSQGVCFGAKLVRGAYMLSERSRAETLHYPDPVHSTIEDTAKMYGQAVDFMFGRIRQNPESNTVIVATHNEIAIEHAMARMLDYNIAKRGGSIMFAQIFGMGDYITYTLGKEGFLAYKSIPYGSLRDTLPYLSRRAQENRAILQGTRRERELLKAALLDRLWPKIFTKGCI